VKLLVTGGAGYVGSVHAAHLVEAGHDVLVVDDLSTGHADAVPEGARFLQADLAAAALRPGNDATVQEQARADEKLRQADFAKERALMAADDRKREVERIAAELEAAKRDPACREQLEKPVCAALR